MRRRWESARVIALAALASLAVWLVDAVVDTLVEGGSAIAHVLHPSAVAIWPRLFTFAVTFTIVIVFLRMRRTEERLRQFSQVVEEAPDGVQILDLEGRILYSNRAAERIFERPAAELAGRRIDELSEAVDGQAMLPAVRQYDRWAGEVTVHGRDRADVTIALSASTVRGPDGGPAALVGILRDVTATKRTEADLREREQHAALAADVGLALAADVPLRELLRTCAGAIVRHLDAALARIWTLEDEGRVLVMQASAGLYTHTDGRHGRVLVGDSKIGEIARSRRPVLTNQVLGDPQFHDREWALREGIVSFAGYPLIVEGRLMGVVAMFARKPLTDATLQAIGSMTHTLSLGIVRKSEALELVAAKEAAEAADRTKTEFLDIVSHELRTPLNALGLNLQLVRSRTARERPVGVELIERMEHQIQHLAQMVSELLDVSRLARGKLEIRTEPVDLSPIVTRMIEDFRQQALDRAITLDLPPVPAFAEVDASRIEQVLGNLIDNALKYSPAGSPVEVEVELQEGLVVLSVRDHGPGIAPEEQARLFNRFYRLSGETKFQPGLGLGLYICRAIVTSHGGTIALQSEMGSGCCFRVSLPRRAIDHGEQGRTGESA